MDLKSNNFRFGSSQLSFVQILDCVHEVGRAIVSARANDFKIKEKSLNNPVTEIDLRAEEMLVAALRGSAPIWSEETNPKGVGWHGEGWLIDPVDGTKSLIEGADGFSVMVAYVAEGRAIAGCVHAPLWGRTWIGDVSQGAWRVELDTTARSVGDVNNPHNQKSSIWRQVSLERDARTTPPTWIESQHHPNQTLLNIRHSMKSPSVTQSSVGLKAGRILDGDADIYVVSSNKIGPWDLAAPMALIEAAGGSVVCQDPLRFATVPWAAPKVLYAGHSESLQHFEAI